MRRQNSARALAELWLPSDYIHRGAKGTGWALKVYVQGEDGGRDDGEGRAVRTVDVESLGVDLLSQLPQCLQRCCRGPACGGGAGGKPMAHPILVRVDAAKLPASLCHAAAADGAVDGDLFSSLLRGGGGLRHRTPWALCTPFMVLAWFFNLCVFAYGLVFFAFAYFVLFDEAENAEWTQEVMGSFAVALVLEFAISDVLVAIFIALLPARSGKTRRPLNVFCGYLASLVCN
jgi:hypothetical protein